MASGGTELSTSRRRTESTALLSNWETWNCLAQQLGDSPREMELAAKAGFVGRLEQTWPQMPVNFDQRPNDLLGPIPEPPSLLASLFHIPLSVAAFAGLRQYVAHRKPGSPIRSRARVDCVVVLTGKAT